MAYKQGLANMLIHLLALGQCALAVAIIVVVRQNLWWLVSMPSGVFEVCLMTTEEVSINMCSYTYWVVGLSFFLSIALMFSQCFIRERRSYILATVGMTAVGTIWWLAYAITATVYGQQANDAEVEEESARNAAWIMGWVNFVLYFGALVIGGLVAAGKVQGMQQLESVPECPPGAYQMAYQGGTTAGTAWGYPQQYPQYPQQYPPPPPGYGAPYPQGYPYPPPQQQAQNPFASPAQPQQHQQTI